MYILTYDAHFLNDKSHTERYDKVWEEKEMGMKAGLSLGDEVPKSEVPLKFASGGHSYESQWRQPPKFLQLAGGQLYC